MIMSKQMLYYINMLLRRRLFHDYNISHSAADTPRAQGGSKSHSKHNFFISSAYSFCLTPNRTVRPFAG